MLDVSIIKTPCYVIDEAKLISNLEILKSVQDKTGCKILLAQKAFSNFNFYPLISKYLAGTTASGINEAMLSHDYMPNAENHVFAPAYTESDMSEIVKICDHIVFNSFGQWEMHKNTIKNSGRNIECGIRINPEYSEIETDIYNPCFKGSRMGVTLKNFDDSKLDGISGLHFHTMCEQNSDTLERTIKVVDEKFGRHLKNMKWINFGGGHHITRDDYDIQKLIECIMYFKNKYHIQVYLEPGEAVALNAGYLVSSVLDIIENGMDIAILDASAACHMPDVLEMPYRPDIIGSGKANEKKYTYRLGGNTCLAGDIIGDYSFDAPLKINDKLIFCDMAIYTIVKNNTFNGINLPSIAVLRKNGSLEMICEYNYEHFAQRLGNDRIYHEQ
ncbi:carboxynorspermidine decarboxylase [Porcipelethomonas sp.]|uniref:carboxynorspermidine decarboxylase n=1 Tax=Porcipelethomonas sp. TaxID=2981675 RepID=UPI003EF4CD0E